MAVIDVARALKWTALPALCRIRTHLPLGRVRGPMTFIVGCGRSGTSIFGRATGLHPGIRYFNEPIHYWFAIDPRTDATSFFGRSGDCWLDAASGSERAARRLDRLFGQVQGHRVLLEKLPMNSLRMEWLDAICPGARFVHLVRDGRAVVESIGRIHHEGTYRVAGRDSHQWWGRQWIKWKRLAREGRLRGFYPEGLSAIGGEEATDPHAMGAYEWLVSIRQVRESTRKLSLGPDRFLESRYEEFLADTVGVLESLEGFLGVADDEDFLAAASAQVTTPRRVAFDLALPRPLYEDFVEMQLALGYDSEGVRPA